MIITLVIDQYDIEGNGTTVSAKRFAEALEKRGHEVRIVTTGKEKENRYIVPEKKDIVAYFAKKQKMAIGKPEKKVLRQAFEGADVVHFMLPLFLGVKGKKIADEMGIPTTAAFHLQPENVSFNIGMGEIEGMNHFIYHFFRKTFYDHFSFIHCPSPFISEELKKHHYQGKIYTISNGIDPIFVPGPITPKKENDKFRILMVGRYSPEKKQEILIDAISKCRYQDNIELVFAGSGPDEQKLRKLAEKKLLNPATFAFYSKQELLKTIRSCDLYVHTSEIEIEAISCMEAFACGLVPVIADSAKSATKQFALDERSLFKVNDSLDLAKKIEYWMEHSEEKERMSVLYAKSADQYRLDKSIDKMMEMFEDAINEKRRK